MKLKTISGKTGISIPHLSKIFNGVTPAGKEAMMKISKITGRNWWEYFSLKPDEIRKEIESAIEA